MSKLYVFPVITTGLGLWQLYRLNWKLDLIERMQHQPLEIQHFQPTSSTLSTSDTSKDYSITEFDLYKLKGKFGDSVFIGPRPRAQHLPPSTSSIDVNKLQYERNIGWIMVSAFKTVFGSVLVNRGWVPDSDLKVVQGLERDSTLENDTRELVAQARTSEPKSMFVSNDQGWKTIDVDALSRHLDTLPLLFEVSSQYQSTNLNEVEDKVWTRTTKREIKNDHLEYAVTWLGLSLFLTMMIRTKGRHGRMFR